MKVRCKKVLGKKWENPRRMVIRFLFVPIMNLSFDLSIYLKNLQLRPKVESAIKIFIDLVVHIFASSMRGVRGVLRSQPNICDGDFLLKAVNYFRKKAPL